MSTKDLLLKLLKIPSYSGREEKMVEFIATYAQKCGYDAIIDNGNVIIGNGDFFIATHMDTIERKIEERVENERIYGRGASDAKGSIAAMLLFLEDVKKLNATLVFLKDEEEGGSGSLEFVKKHRGEYAIIMEPTSLRICRYHAGNIEVVFEVIDEESHGSFCGGAIEKAIEMINELKSMDCWMQGKYFDSCITMQEIKGGGKFYLNPARCEGRMEARLLPEQNAYEIAEKIKNVIGKYGNADFREIWNGFVMDDAQFLGKIKEACKKAGILFEEDGMKSWTDAIVFNNAGIKSIVFGPGNLKYSHTVNEYIELSEIEKSAEFLHAINEIME